VSKSGQTREWKAGFEPDDPDQRYAFVIQKLAHYAGLLKEALLEDDLGNCDLAGWALAHDDGSEDGYIADLFTADASVIAKMCLLIEREAARLAGKPDE